jgi:hypothetical protein
VLEGIEAIGSQGRGAARGPFPHPPFNPYVRFLAYGLPMIFLAWLRCLRIADGAAQAIQAGPAVSPSAVRDFRGVMTGRGDKGLLIITGTFTADAKKEATRDGAHRSTSSTAIASVSY